MNYITAMITFSQLDEIHNCHRNNPWLICEDSQPIGVKSADADVADIIHGLWSWTEPWDVALFFSVSWLWMQCDHLPQAPTSMPSPLWWTALFLSICIPHHGGPCPPLSAMIKPLKLPPPCLHHCGGPYTLSPCLPHCGEPVNHALSLPAFPTMVDHALSLHMQFPPWWTMSSTVSYNKAPQVVTAVRK